MADTITDETMANLVYAGAIRTIRVVQQPDDGSWVVVVVVGMAEMPIRGRRKAQRKWRRLNSVARWLRETAGVNQFRGDGAGI